ncbi:MAG: FHA domain-containing protein [Dokdonella sp.]
MVKAREEPEALSGVDLSVIDALKALKQDADVLRGRLAGLKSMKADFDGAVYTRVHADYAAKLAGFESQAEPLRQQARDTYARLRGVLAGITSAHDAVKLDRQEIELRHKLGEFDDVEYNQRVNAIESALAERAAAHQQGEALRGRFLEVFESEEELLQASNMIDIPGPASTQEMPVAVEPAAAPSPPPPQTQPARDVREIPVAQTQILQVLKLPEPPRVPPPPPTGVPTALGATFGPSATMSLRTARLVPQNPEAGRTAVPLPPKPISLGADAANEVRIGGPGVEARHAQITVDNKGYTLSDLGSKSGTRINAEAVQQRLLKHEDVIQIGMARFVFREG